MEIARGESNQMKFLLLALLTFLYIGNAVQDITLLAYLVLVLLLIWKFVCGCVKNVTLVLMIYSGIHTYMLYFKIKKKYL